MISIVIPIYNTEIYLKLCLESVKNQTFSDFEAIMVDDGSTDNSRYICQDFCSNDKRFYYYYKENGGISDARNFGLNKCRGEYVFFLDSDDYINARMLETLYNNIEDKDIAICNFNIVNHKEAKIDTCLNDKGEIKRIERMDSLDLLNNLYNNIPIIFNVVWNKLYSIELFDDIRFPKGKIHEDDFIIHELYYKSNGAIFLDYTGYNYVQRNDSITHNNYSKKNIDSIEVFVKRHNFFKDKNLRIFIKKNIKAFVYVYAKNMNMAKKYRKDLLYEVRKYDRILKDDIKYVSEDNPVNIIFYYMLLYVQLLITRL